MELPEQADSSAESIIRPNVIDRLESEHARAGSTMEYVRQLGVWYQEYRDHVPNLLQLQRMARMITNPINEPTFPDQLSNAFYWGEILAYRVQDLLSEGEWVTDAYPMFSGVMLEHYETAQLFFDDPASYSRMNESGVAERSHAEELQAMGDFIMTELEEGDVEFMPPVMEELIIALTDELSSSPEERWYIILGFRHITMRVVEKSVDAQIKAEADIEKQQENKELAKEIAREQKVRKALRKQFLKLMDKNEVDDIQGREMIHVDIVRGKIMESYADHMLAYGEYDDTDEDDLDKARTFLNQAMGRDFSDMEDIEAGDFLQFGGEAVFITFNEDDESESIRLLGRNEFLEGTVEGVVTAETPSTEKILGWQKNLVSVTELEDGTNQLGVLLILKDPVLVNKDGSHIQAGENRTVGVIMTNPHMEMSKYLL